MEVNRSFFNLIFLFSIFSIFTISRSDEAACVYTLFVKTSTTIKGGTDSKISITFYDAAGFGIRINDIEAWGGLMGPKYNYFERGNLDMFSGRGPCLTGPICTMSLTSDGTGSGHGWFCNFVVVSSTDVHVAYFKKFEVQQWLATDASPFKLSTVKNLCSGSTCWAGPMNCRMDSSRVMVV